MVSCLVPGPARCPWGLGGCPAYCHLPPQPPSPKHSSEPFHISSTWKRSAGRPITENRASLGHLIRTGRKALPGEAALITLKGRQRIPSENQCASCRRNKTTLRKGSLSILFSRHLALCLVSVSYTHLTLPTIHVLCRSRWSPYH